MDAAMAATTHLERTAEEPREAELHEVTLGGIEVNEGIRLFRFDLGSGPDKFSPGQWLDTYVPGIATPGGFSITSAPSAAAGPPGRGRAPPSLELAVKDSPGNAVAAWLWRPAGQILGSKLCVRVGGDFVFPPPSHERLDGICRVVLVAGGVGINPLVSMLRHLGETRDPLAAALDVCLVYATRLPSSGRLRDVLFLETMATLFGQDRLRGSLRLHLTRGGGGGGVGSGILHMCGASVDVRPGRLDGQQVRALVEEKHPESSLVYVCGPPTMTDELVAALTAPGTGPVVDPGRVMTEKWW